MRYIHSRKHACPQPASTALGLLALALPVNTALANPGATQAAPLNAPTVTVSAQKESYKTEHTSSPKQTQPILNTPQTLTVINEQLMREQAATSLNDVLRNTPGVTLLLGEGGNSNTKDNIFLRGFDTSGSVFVDGVRDLGNFGRDVFNTEQVEVIKGPSGSEYGRGAPSATLNLASKVARAEDFASATLSLGTAHQKRTTADLNTRLGDRSAARLNLMAQDSGVPGRDKVENTALGIAPSLAFGLGTSTRFYLNYLHLQQDNRPDGGIPTVGLNGYYNAALANAGITPPRAVERNNYYGKLTDHEDVNVDMFTARLEHDLQPGVVLRNVARAGKAQHMLILTAPQGAVSDGSGNNAVARPDPETWTADLRRHGKWQENRLLTNQTSLSAQFDTAGIGHNLNAGIEFIYEEQLSKTRDGLGTLAPQNLWRPNLDAPLSDYNPGFSGAQTRGTSFTVGTYLFDTLTFSDQWLLSGGVRLDKYTVDSNILSAPNDATPPTQTGTALADSDTLFSWKLSPMFKPTENGTIYLAYSTSQQPPGGSNFTLNANANNINNPNMDPSKASNIELGTKWEVLDNRLALSAAIYRSDVRNDVTQTDPVTGDITQYGKKQVKGIEVGAVGQVTEDWSLSAGLAKMDTSVERGSQTQQGASLNWSPELTLTAWSTYRLPFGLTLGGGARYVDSMVRRIDNTAQAATTNMLEVPSYWVFDAMAEYEINRHVAVQLNVANLADKAYIANLNNNGNRYIPGAERSALLTTRVQF